MSPVKSRSSSGKKISPTLIRAGILTLIKLLIAGWCVAQSTGSITGKITEAGTLKPVPYATIFLANTLIGTRTDDEGMFTLNAIPVGKYDLTVSCVGYQLSLIPFDFKGGEKKVSLAIKPSTTLLKEVVVKAKPSAYRRHLLLFKKCFLGETANAAKCTIVNIGEINIDYDEDNKILTASCDKPIIVENTALGYRIYYLLTQFKVNYKTGYLEVSGIPRFESMLTEKRNQLKSWIRERDRAYHGSISHFMTSLKYSCLSENQFSLYRLEADMGTGSFNVEHNTINDTSYRVVRITEAGLFARPYDEKQFLKITYDGELEERNYHHPDFSAIGSKRSVPPLGVQTSYLHFKRHGLIIYNNGYFEDEMSYIQLGYFGFSNTVAELVPDEYRPGSGNIFKTDEVSEKIKNDAPSQQKEEIETVGLPGKISSLSGKITDGATHLPVIATVFFANTLVHTTSQRDGSFLLSAIQPGKYDLVVAAAGYRPVPASLVFSGSAETNDFVLFPMPRDSDVLVNRKKYEKKVRTFFNGQSPNADDCEIKNIEDLFLHYDPGKQVLTAHALKPVLIDNAKLGYTITYFLTEFKYNDQDGSYSVTGQGYLDEMRSSDARRIRGWEAERIKSWTGSLPDFIHSIGEKSLQRNGFEVSRITHQGVTPIAENWFYEDRADQIITVQVVCKNLLRNYFFQTQQQLDAFRTSTITLSKGTMINWPNGYIEPPYVYDLQGYFLNESCLGELLPREYLPSRPHSAH